MKDAPGSTAEVSGYWAVAFASSEAGWFVGNGGKILKITFEHS